MDDAGQALVRQQFAVCRQHGLAPCEPEAMVALALSTVDARPIHGARIALPENGTISWFLHGGEPSADAGFYQPVHASHLRDVLPGVMKYLWLPPGSRFIIDDAGYEDVWVEPGDEPA